MLPQCWHFICWDAMSKTMLPLQLLHRKAIIHPFLSCQAPYRCKAFLLLSQFRGLIDDGGDGIRLVQHKDQAVLICACGGIAKELIHLYAIAG